MDNWIDTHGRFLRGELEAYLATGKDYQGLIRKAEEFTEALCRRSALRDVTTRLLPEWLSTKHPASADARWESFVQKVLYSVSLAEDEQYALPAVGLNEALGGVYDQPEPEEPDLARIEEQAAKATIREFYEISRQFQERAARASSPIYQLIASDPERYQTLLALFGALGADMFEALAKEFKGLSVEFPSEEALAEFTRDRNILEERNKGAKTQALADRYHVSPSRVSQIVREQRELRRTRSLDDAMISALNRVNRAKYRARVHQGLASHTI
jgi:Mor family transcriptional regulator